MKGIRQVLLLRKSKNNILKFQKKKKMAWGKRKDFLRRQNIAPKLRRNVLNTRTLIMSVSENNRLKRRSKLLNTRTLIVTGIRKNDRLKRRSKLLNARTLIVTVSWEVEFYAKNIHPTLSVNVVFRLCFLCCYCYCYYRCCCCCCCCSLLLLICFFVY